MSDAIHTETLDGFTLSIVHDDDASTENPLTRGDEPGRRIMWAADHFGRPNTLEGFEAVSDPADSVCPACEGEGSDAHEHYGTGDIECGLCEGSGDIRDVGAALAFEHTAAVIVPIRFSDYGGSTPSEIYVSDWSNANAAWLFEPGTVHSEWGETLADQDKARAYVAAAIGETHEWLQGNVYGYVIEDPTGDVVDSCWGFIDADAYSGDPIKSHTLSEGLSALTCTVSDAHETDAKETAARSDAAARDIETVIGTPSPATIAAMRRIVRYSYADELADYEEQDDDGRAGHVFRDLATVDAFLQGAQA
jgi:hypothetical protein